MILSESFFCVTAQNLSCGEKCLHRGTTRSQAGQRLAKATDPRLGARSLDPKAVEGDSEIDLVLDSKEMSGYSKRSSARM